MRWAVAAGISLCLAGCTTITSNRSTTRAALTPAVGTPAPQSTADDMVSGAVAMLGQPYRYAGSTPGGFDCSGLVVYAAAHAGLTLPRTAKQQLHAGSAIARRNVRAGDLVFMRLSSNDLHVGIALDALRFVHAPSRGGRVRIDYLDRPPYVRAFLNARRVADNTLPDLR